MSTRGNPQRTSSIRAAGLRVALVVSMYNEQVTKRLLDGAQECLRRHGIGQAGVGVFFCPGAFELPQVARALTLRGEWDAVVCLGAVIQGETRHFEFVAREAARGIQHVALTSGVPVIFGVLTTENTRQALDRAGGRLGNKGWEAALAGIEMATLIRSLGRSRRRKKR